VKTRDRRERTAGDQYSETNVMQFLFNLLRIKSLYMFRALLAHPQEALNKRYLEYCVRVMSVGCTRVGVEHQVVLSHTPSYCLLVYQYIGYASGYVISHSVFCLFVRLFLAQQPPVSHGFLIHEVFRSHTTTHHSRYDSSGRVISSSPRPLPDNTKH
jgi:hypothetical protein